MLNMILIYAFAVAIFLVIYHHAIYPLMLKIVSKDRVGLKPEINNRRYTFSVKDRSLNRFSIIIPAFNEAKFIAEKIRNLSFIDYPNDRYELILLCDGCQDDTYYIALKTLNELACHDLNVQLVNFEDNRGKVVALKEGVTRATFENIVFSDVSALLPVNCLLMLDSHFKNPTVGAVSGGYKFIQRGSEGEQSYWRYQSAVKSRESSIASVLGAHGAFYALRKSCYEEVPADTINDDYFYYLAEGQSAVHLAYSYLQVEKLAQAKSIIDGFTQFIEKGKEKISNDPSYYYNLSLINALQNKKNETYQYLQAAIDAGWVTVWQAKIEPIFTSLNQDAQFELMMGGVTARLTTMKNKMNIESEFLLADSILK